MKVSRLLSRPSYWIFWILWNGLIKHVMRGCLAAYADSAERDWQRTVRELEMLESEDDLREAINLGGLADYHRRVRES